MSKERLKQVTEELEKFMKNLVDSPRIFDLFVSTGGDEEHGYYFSANAVPRPKP